MGLWLDPLVNWEAYLCRIISRWITAVLWSFQACFCLDNELFIGYLDVKLLINHPHLQIHTSCSLRIGSRIIVPPEHSDHFHMPFSLIFRIQLGTRSSRCHLKNAPPIASSCLLPLPRSSLGSPVYNLLLIFQLSLNLPQVHPSVILPPKSYP